MERIRSELEFFGFTVTSLVAEGNPAKTIDRVAREQDVSLIVIGSHGRSATEDVLLGSVSDAVICQTHPARFGCQTRYVLQGLLNEGGSYMAS